MYRQAEPVMDTCDGSIYERLPGNRWIRLLQLEPAERLEDGLVATLHLQDLGGPLPVWPLNGAAHGSQGDRIASHEYWKEIRRRQLSYNALSYSWATEDGNDRRTHKMNLNRRMFRITKNLSDGLRRIRSAKTTECLWIDAICISQDDPAERSAQVSMMFDIYRSARLVLVWLGNGDDDLDNHTCALARSIDAILQYAQDTRVYKIIEDCIKVFARADIHDSCACRNYSHHYQLDGPSRRPGHFTLSELSRAIGTKLAEQFKAKENSASRLLLKVLKAAAIVDRRYWTRRWIIQEIQALLNIHGCVFLWAGHMASATTFFAMITAFATWNVPHSHHGIELSSIREELATISHRTLPSSPLPARLTAHLDTDGFEKDFLVIVGDLSGPIHNVMLAERHRSDLLYLLRKFAMYECSNVHDRVFSLMALDPSHNLQADYSLSFAQLCLSFAKNSLSRGDFRILNYACLPDDCDEGQSALNLPSWVPDLRTIPGAGSTLAVMRANTILAASKIQSNAGLLLESFWLGNVVDVAHISDRDSYHTSAISLSRSIDTNTSPAPSLEIGPPRFEQIRNMMICPGDVICVLDEYFWNRSILGLRPTGTKLHQYTLILAVEIVDIRGSDFDHVHFHSLPESKRAITII
ncbi:hypothetical protein CKM354_000218600 [Cercospora kikuchii]|uniref:Heterokaryon incompatibility domain-containing protein n=1 Tax=Cercospora kikuchii TaxID=84275 RepID=A0A9P3CF24_9PEZI|nr:uncharacterized protein CKM354_000218600 [Cercospora kikuchii]GIZ38785.1 hypothetical protein CKM354_000218600 [Cercospora kikuchii]